MPSITPSECALAYRPDSCEWRRRCLRPLAEFEMAGARRKRSVHRHRQGFRPAVLNFAGASSARVRHGSPKFILKLTAGIKSSPWFVDVRQSSPALLSRLLSKRLDGRVHLDLTVDGTCSLPAERQVPAF